MFLYKRVVKRNVKVIDDEKPVIILKGDNPVNVCINHEVGDYEYTALDNYDGDITSKVQIEKKDDQIIYKVKDSSGNRDVKYRNINLIKDEKPVITLKGDSTVYVYKGSSFKDAGYTAKDTCDGDITKNVITTGKVDISKTGTYKIKYTIKDSSNKEASITRIVKVITRTSAGNGYGNGKIYLTFDDGPSSSITPKLLNILKE